MSVLGILAIAAAAVVAIGWLAVSFLRPSRWRTAIEWIAATGLYAALFTFFLSLCERALAEGSTVALVGFGFLATMFGLGLVVSAFKTVAAIRGRSSSGIIATN